MNDSPVSTQQDQPTAPDTPAMINPNSAPAIGPKELLEHALTQVEGVIANTPSDPIQRAAQIQAIKAAYIKARYNVDVGPQLTS